MENRFSSFGADGQRNGKLGIFPSKTKKKEAVLQFINTFDDAIPQIRRIWTDGGPEFAAAAKTIRQQRPFAHYVSIPGRATSNGKAENSNRLVVEGGRCNLIQASFNEAWWPFAVAFWTTMYNAFKTNKDGFTPYMLRHGEWAPHKEYPFGALVLMKINAKKPGERLDKWSSRLIPCVLVEVTIGPAGRWAHQYGVVVLRKLVDETRGSRARVRRTCDLVFPDKVTFPLRQRLSLAGAYADITLPSPGIKEGEETWEIECGGSSTDDDALPAIKDGFWAENAPILQHDDSLAMALALEGEGEGESQEEIDADLQAEGGEIDFAAVNADLEEERETAKRVEQELRPQDGGRRPPAGWRIDVFGARRVSTPPWSLRPPTYEPEVWISFPKSVQKEEREKWKLKDPDGFHKQEERCRLYRELRSAGKAPVRAVCSVQPSEVLRTTAATTARTIAAPSATEPGPVNNASGDDCFAGLQVHANRTSRESGRSQEFPSTITCRACVLRKPAKKSGALVDMMRDVRRRILTDDFSCLLIELCYELRDAVLSAAVPDRCLAVRISSVEDATSRATNKAIHSLIRIAKMHGLNVHGWISLPCTAVEPTMAYVRAALPICEHLNGVGETFTWEWPEGSSLWNIKEVKDALQKLGTKTCLVKLMLWA